MFDLREILVNRKNKSCLVVGDIILDKYIYGDVGRISPEAPIPVLRASSEKMVLGGAANVAGNVKGYKLETYLAGVLGADSEALDMKKIFTDKGLNFVGIESDNRRTTVKTRVIGMNQQLVRIDKEDIYSISDSEEKSLLENISEVICKVDSVILSDYNKGVCTVTFCRKLINLCFENNVKVIVDPKSSDWTKYCGAYLITPNFKEFKEAIGYDVENDEKDIDIAAKELLAKYNLEHILVTRSQYGMTLVQKGKKTQTYSTVQQEVFDVSGAGDTVIGTIAALTALGYELNNSVEVSNYAAGLSVSKAGTYMVSVEDVIEYINRFDVDFRCKVVDVERLANMVHNWKETGEKIVFTNGCFDILHIGHIDYMNRASRLGTKMIIGLNSDSSVKRLKGKDRPINNEKVRSEMLAALACVDAVVIFEEDTPENLIKRIKPDFLVKGGDYKVEDIIGREYAKEVRVIELTEGYSTTNIIEKIKTM